MVTKEENKATTITITKETWSRLRRYQLVPSDTFDRVINKLMDEKEW